MKYDRDTINRYLGEPTTLPEDGRVTYQRMTKWHEFNNGNVANLLYIPGHTYEVGTSGKPLIHHPSMRTITQIWANFLLANVILKTHESDINMDKAHLIWCIIQGLQVDVVAIISYEMQRIITHHQQLVAPLDLWDIWHSSLDCANFMVRKSQLIKWRASDQLINKACIETHYTNPLKEV